MCLCSALLAFHRAEAYSAGPEIGNGCTGKACSSLHVLLLPKGRVWFVDYLHRSLRRIRNTLPAGTLLCGWNPRDRERQA